jgi:hypothetical protein
MRAEKEIRWNYDNLPLKVLLPEMKRQGYTFDEKMFEGLPESQIKEALLASWGSQVRGRCKQNPSQFGGKRRMKNTRKVKKSKAQKKRGTRRHARS